MPIAQRHLTTLILAAITTAACAFAGEDTVVLHDDFDSKFDLPWTQIRPDTDAFSFDANPGVLTVTTQYGSIHGTTSPGDFAKNIFLLDKVLEADQNFEATLHVAEFAPETYYHQIAVLVYQGDDDYAKWSLERSWQEESTDNTVLVRETDAQTEHSAVAKKTIDGPFWLRVERSGTNYTCSYSNDGDDFEIIGTESWQPSSSEKPVRVGFLAKNGGNRNASDVDVLLESFRLELLPRETE